jgi:hypothetical protein
MATIADMFSPLRVLFARKLAPPKAASVGSLRAGDWVEIRPLGEVLATLDAQGCLDALPFMPEMARFCGQRFQISKTAHNTCALSRARRLGDAVHLAELRCDGGFHGGCQAGCLFFWKEAWLRRVDGPRAGPDAAATCDCAAAETEAFRDSVAGLARQACVDDRTGSEPRHRCQATELMRATKPLSVLDASRYLHDLISGNITWWSFLRALGISLYNKLQRLCGARPYPFGGATASAEPPIEVLNLQPGELVQVRSKEEIMATLDAGGRNRGLSADGDMVPYFGRTFRVLRRVDHILDERTGKMLRLRKDCIVLDGVVCDGLHTGIRRLGCTRSIYPYWREAWLRRVEPAPGRAAATGAPAPCSGCARPKLEASS